MYTMYHVHVFDTLLPSLIYWQLYILKWEMSRQCIFLNFHENNYKVPEMVPKKSRFREAALGILLQITIKGPDLLQNRSQKSPDSARKSFFPPIITYISTKSRWKFFCSASTEFSGWAGHTVSEYLRLGDRQFQIFLDKYSPLLLLPPLVVSSLWVASATTIPLFLNGSPGPHGDLFGDLGPLLKFWVPFLNFRSTFPLF